MQSNCLVATRRPSTGVVMSDCNAECVCVTSNPPKVPATCVSIPCRPPSIKVRKTITTIYEASDVEMITRYVPVDLSTEEICDCFEEKKKCCC